MQGGPNRSQVAVNCSPLGDVRQGDAAGGSGYQDQHRLGGRAESPDGLGAWPPMPRTTGSPTIKTNFQTS